MTETEQRQRYREQAALYREKRQRFAALRREARAVVQCSRQSRSMARAGLGG